QGCEEHAAIIIGTADVGDVEVVAPDQHQQRIAEAVGVFRVASEVVVGERTEPADGSFEAMAMALLPTSPDLPGEEGAADQRRCDHSGYQPSKRSFPGHLLACKAASAFNSNLPQ